MPDELMFVVEESDIRKAEPVTLQQVGLQERSHLQEWVLAHPEIIGPDILVMTSEFDRWVTPSGERDRDRLDVLGLDKSGYLVVAELKRGAAPESILTQALRYAAMASQFTPERLAEHYARYLSKNGPPVTEESAAESLEEWVNEGLEELPLAPPRVVLLAAAFDGPVTSTVEYLTKFDLEISVRVFQPYETPGGELLLTVSQLWPPPTFAIGPMAGGSLAETRERRRETNAVARIREAGALEPGAELRFKPIEQVSEEVKEQIEEWMSENPARAIAHWDLQKKRRPLKWAADNKLYSPTKLALKIMAEGAGQAYQSLRGTVYWVDSEGRSLVAIAESADE